MTDVTCPKKNTRQNFANALTKARARVQSSGAWQYNLFDFNVMRRHPPEYFKLTKDQADPGASASYGVEPEQTHAGQDLGGRFRTVRANAGAAESDRTTTGTETPEPVMTTPTKEQNQLRYLATAAGKSGPDRIHHR